ncbi:MAG: cation diffusion facilitator family transporter [Myxococcota bacterium]
MTEGSRRAILAAFLANLGIAAAKFAAFLATGAASMLAEAVHSLADSANQGLLILGGALAGRAPTPEHPFGYGRERYFWAFIVALVLFSMGSLFAISEGVAKLRDPHELASTGWAIGVLLLAIGLEGWSLRTAVREARKLRGSLGWWSFVRRSKQPELPVVLLEDLGALIGLVIALLGVGLASWLGDPRFDALGSIAIGVLLGVIAVILAVEMKSLLIGESASAAHQRAILAAIEETPGVRRLIHLRTQHIGPEELLVGAKLEFDRGLDVAVVAATIDEVEAAIRARVPVARVIYLEPDVYRQPAAEAKANP